MNIKAICQNQVVRLAAFLALLVVILHACNTYLIKIDLFSYLTLEELEHTEDIELAVVGSSYVQSQFDAPLIEEKTGQNTFCVSVPYLALPGATALTDQMFDHNHPEHVVLVIDPLNYEDAGESIESQFRVMPHLKGFARRARYYLEMCRADGQYFERLFLFRTFPIDCWFDVDRAFRLRADPAAYYKQQDDYWKLVNTYMGRGFTDYARKADPQTVLANLDYLHDLTVGLEPSQEMLDALLRYRDLCAEHGAQLIVLVYPYMPAYMDANPGCKAYCEQLADFCSQSGLCCYDLNLARPELMADLTPHYSDRDQHLSPSGAQLLSEAFSSLYRAHAEGGDTDALFYDSYADRPAVSL